MNGGKAVRIFLVAVLMAVLVTGAAWGDGVKVFSDVEPGVWYEQPVAEMKAKGIIKGATNEAGEEVFSPDKPMTVQEAIVFLGRLLNWDSSSTQVPITFLNRDKVADWAKGYMTAAINKGVISGADLYAEPAQPAKRYEIAIFAVKALGLDDEARGRSGMMLDFADADEIPLRAVGYVDVADEEGILSGYGGKFYPNESITRAQMAAVLARLDEKIDVARDNVVKAEFIGLSSYERALTVKKADGEFEKYFLSDDALIFRDNNKIALDQLKPLEPIALTLNAAGEAGYIEVIDAEELAQEQEYTVKGTLTAVDVAGSGISIEKEGGQEVTYDVGDEVEILLDYKSAELVDLVAGQPVEVTVEKGLVTQILAESIEETVEGTAVKVDFGVETSIVINTEDGAEQSYVVADNVDIDGDADSLRDIITGQQVELELKNKKVVNIDVTNMEEEVEGVVQKIVLAADPEIVVKVDGQERSFAFADDAVMEKSGKDISIEDLKVGDYVELEVIGSVITSMEVTAKIVADYLIGEIENVNRSAEVIILKNSNRPIYLNDDTEIIKFGSDVSLRHLDPGDEIIAVGRLNSGILEATTIVVISATE
ncbi:MAG: S-layer homology domain-containing protein [Thermoanaerobacteraceae bacterium]|nr:S-layer homology domain-containing protein [Thermoanaerobacteraceae bacterium]